MISVILWERQKPLENGMNDNEKHVLPTQV